MHQTQLHKLLLFYKSILCLWLFRPNNSTFWEALETFKSKVISLPSVCSILTQWKQLGNNNSAAEY